MNATYDFTGQVALVTGVSSGMGLATAQAFAHAGAAVVPADINNEALQTATAEPRSRWHEALGVPCDVPDEPADTFDGVRRWLTSRRCRA